MELRLHPAGVRRRTHVPAAPRRPGAVLITPAAVLVGALAAAAALLALVAASRLRARREDAWLADPARDPGEGLAGDGLPALPDPAAPLTARVRGLLDATDRARPWRAPLRPLRDEVPALVAAGEGALAAELLARLGHLDEALALAGTLPPDAPGACFARHLAYRAAGDLERAEGALVAATALADPGDRARYRRALDRWRAAHPRYRSAAERLWDPE